MKLDWTQELSVGVDVIDKQHQQFFKIFNEMYDNEEAGKSQEKIEKTLAELKEYANYHFATEEKYFKEFNFSGADEHIKKHKEMLEKIDHLSEMQKNGETAVVLETIYFLEDWLTDHLSKMDRKYIDCFHDHGLV